MKRYMNASIMRECAVHSRISGKGNHQEFYGVDMMLDLLDVSLTVSCYLVVLMLNTILQAALCIHVLHTTSL